MILFCEKSLWGKSLKVGVGDSNLPKLSSLVAILDIRYYFIQYTKRYNIHSKCSSTFDLSQDRNCASVSCCTK